MGSNEPASSRVRVRRHAERGAYDRSTLDAILDEGLICHLGVVVDGRPHVVPTMYARKGDTVFVHGALANQALTALRTGAEACLVVTLLDGLVLARSAFNHSMNYRSVVILGTATEVTAEGPKLEAMKALLDTVAPGRWDDSRSPNPREMAATVILALSLAEASAKVRTGPPVDEPADMTLDFWAGVVPLRMEAGEAVDDPALRPGMPRPSYITGYRRGTTRSS